jgi:hypothetical protein
MKIFIAVTVFSAVLTVTHAQRATTFGSGDISNLLQNNGIVQQQINCVLDKSPCDELGRMLKCKCLLKLLLYFLVYLIIL